ncbi:hypothetical protein CDAR_488311 [Caerostris darwini]|uniref:Uncharacterized protein n=1 Tax=Caerostris darwini TaxID=1538125 RepID=A0AAV4Q1E9_9ARAC|nr:hypothetical protein CDAR_488311 [Caerostris darwini]
MHNITEHALHDFLDTKGDSFGWNLAKLAGDRYLPIEGSGRESITSLLIMRASKSGISADALPNDLPVGRIVCCQTCPWSTPGEHSTRAEEKCES